MDKDPISQNIIGVQSLVGSKLNKTSEGASNQLEGIAGDYEDEFSLDLTDDELLELAKKWTSEYAGYEAKLKLRQEANKTYYLGKQKEGGAGATTEGQPISANLLFEAEETFLPAALSKNPEPVVWSDDTKEGDQLANNVKTMLQYHADTLVLRRKLTLLTRHWSIYFIGVIKHGWDTEIEEIKSDVKDPRNFIFNVNGFIDSYGDYEGPLGERITCCASKLVDLFPKHKAFVTIAAQGKMGTDVTYTQWWNDDYCFYTFKGRVLDKHKNPHFNYAKKEKTFDLVTGEVSDVESEPKKNHFAKPKKPYTFLSVFSLGEQPHDITGLIEQNIPNQRRITRRTEQIDYNLSRANNSVVFSENNFNQETAKQASSGMAKGHPILVPSGGPIGDAIHQIPAQGIDNAFFTELENSKTDLRSIFGTEGITSDQKDNKETARGMILKNQFDSSRIGGGIGDALEQVADNIFNWWVQLYHVYYDDRHYASVMGKMKAVEYIELQASDFIANLVISVSPDSMKPHDEITEMNQAMSLYEAGALDPKTLLTRLNFPDPQKTAEQTTLWIVDKATYMQLNFPEVFQQVQQMQAQQQQAQMAQQQQQMEQQGQMSQQDLGVKQAQGEQQLSQKQQAHEQQITQKEQAHIQKMNQAMEAAQAKKLSQEKASASLKNVKLPK